MCYLEEVSALRDVVVDGRLGVELLALAVVGVGGLVWEAVVIGRAVKAEQRPVLDTINITIAIVMIMITCMAHSWGHSQGSVHCVSLPPRWGEADTRVASR